jgi:hypothetical protein
MLNLIHRVETRKLSAFFVLFCLAGLMLAVSFQGAFATELPPDEATWVCVTSPELVSAFEPLAAYRESQGMTTRIITTSQVDGWAYLTPGFTARLREVVIDMVAQWGTQYLLIGGDQSVVEAPYTRLAVGTFIWTAPTDLYYSCLDGDWDGDGDGWVGEGDDDPDLYPDVAVGRLPVDDAEEAAIAIAKTLAFEGRTAVNADQVLLAATVLDDRWQPGEPSPIPFGASHVENILDVLAPSERNYSTTAMLQYWADTPDAVELTPTSLVTALASGDYDFAMILAQGDVDTWSCGEYRYLHQEDLTTLAGGRPFVLDSMVGEGTNLLGEGIIEDLMKMPDGGVVAARGWSTVFYLSPGMMSNTVFWEIMAENEYDRLGDIQNAGIDRFVAVSGSSFNLLHVPIMMLLGDPALIVRAPATTGVRPPRAAQVLHLEAAPNPFNPSTTLSFEIDADPEDMVQVRVEAFDLRGRLVALLHEGLLPAGPHSMTWNAAGQSSGSGVYFLRVQVGGSSEALKIIRLE